MSMYIILSKQITFKIANPNRDIVDIFKIIYDFVKDTGVIPTIEISSNTATFIYRDIDGFVLYITSESKNGNTILYITYGMTGISVLKFEKKEDKLELVDKYERYKLYNEKIEKIVKPILNKLKEYGELEFEEVQVVTTYKK